MEHGFIRVTRMRQITLQDITPELARRSGFSGVVDLLKPPSTARAKRST
jgi:hypothetical protein